MIEALGIAANMREAYILMKRVLPPERYESSIGELRKLIQEGVQQHRAEPIAIIYAMAKTLDEAGDPHGTMPYLMAAAFEELGGTDGRL